MKVIVISNDVVPGMGVPVAAPGLRSFGIYKGLIDSGITARRGSGRAAVAVGNKSVRAACAMLTQGTEYKCLPCEPAVAA